MRRFLAVMVLLAIPLLSMLGGALIAGRLHTGNSTRGLLMAMFGMVGLLIGFAVCGLVTGSYARRREMFRRGIERQTLDATPFRYPSNNRRYP